GNGSDPNASADEALTSIGYTGHEMFWEAGLIHTHARLYDPSIGRWMSPDPTVPDGYDGQSLNRYSYVLNNPTTLVDPSGYADATCWPVPGGGYQCSDMTVVGGSVFGALWVASGGGPGGFGIHANNPNPKKQAKKAKTSCSVSARVIGNNGEPLSQQLTDKLLNGIQPRGAFGMYEAPGTADVRIQQFGFSSNSAFGAIAPFISGTVFGPNGPVMFNGITDVIGPPAAQISLLSQFPGALLLELNSGQDQSAPGNPLVTVKLVFNAPFSCSDLTVPSSSGGGS
ncbi:MAG: RHS repeat-associated core domain-containing protein, partial [Terriglobia bacterium]